jgi:preprotein translocase subunit SecF
MKVVQFLKHRFVFITISVICIIGGLTMTVVRGGFNLGLDFQAGISQTVEIVPGSVAAPIDMVRTALRGIDGSQIQVVGNPENQEYTIKVKQQGESSSFQEDMTKTIISSLDTAFGAGNVKTLKTEYVGPRFSADLASQAAFLTIFALVLILLYSWFRFKLGYAVAAIVATLHDTFFMIGVIGAFQLEVSTATVAAVLTIIGYSLNDTIVIFDRIRENTGLMRESSFPVVINSSLTQTLGRTIITSMTTLLAVVSLFIFGTGDVQGFALNMIIGVVVGTYSSIFIASPVLLGWTNKAGRMKKVREAKRSGITIKPATKTPPLEVAPPQPEARRPTDVEAVTETAMERETRKDALPPRFSREQRKRKAKKS